MPKSRKHLLGFTEERKRPETKYFLGKIVTPEFSDCKYAIISELDKQLNLQGRCDSIEGLAVVLAELNLRRKIKNLGKAVQFKYNSGIVSAVPLNEGEKEEVKNSYKDLEFSL